MMKNNKPTASPKVHCSDCRHFLRDTEGRSITADTGEYFMGICSIDAQRDGLLKVFADKPRHCSQFKNLVQQ